jgi:serine/threonine protein kinase
LAAEQLYRQGQGLIRGEPPFKINVAAGLAKVKQAADFGHGEAASYADYLREDGLCDRNGVEFAHYCRMSSDCGFEPGRQLYGLCLRYGFGVTRDLQAASRYLSIPPERFAPPGPGEMSERPVPFRRTLDELRLNPADRANSRDRANRHKLVNTKTNEITGTRLAMYESRDEMMRRLDEWRSVSHPNIVGKIGFYDPTNYDPTNYDEMVNVTIVTELLARGSLWNVLENQREWERVSATDKMKIIVGVVLGRRYLYQRDLIPGRLHLDSILVDGDFEAKIESFPYVLDDTAPIKKCCLDRITSSDLNTHTVPEMGDSERPISAARDVFALGIVMWEVLTGIPLARTTGMERKTDYLVHRWFMDGNRPDASALLAPTRDLLSQCWRQDPTERPTFNDVFERLRNLKYQLIPGVDSSELEIYVGSVLDREARLLNSE